MQRMIEHVANTCEQTPAVLKQDAYYNVGEGFRPYVEHSFQPEVEQVFRHAIATHGPVRRLLDVGCASGRTSLFTKRLGVKELVGIEIDPRGCEIAGQFFDRVIQGDVAQVPLDYPDGHFEMIFFTDILEHLADPWTTLQRYLRYLAPGGRVLVVLPNIAHIDVISSMLNGLLDYHETGIMDSGHLRIFTQNMAAAMLQRAGLEIEQLVYRLDGSWSTFKDQNSIPLPGGAGALVLDPKVVPEDLKRTYFVRKFHFLARKPS
jgi:SAM-dependent methyltransferase